MNKQAWLDRAAARGFDGLEIYVGRSAGREVKWFGGQMDSFVTSDVTGYSLRAVIGGKTANLALETIDDERIDETLDLLAAQAEIVASEEADVLRAPEAAEPVTGRTVWTAPTADRIIAALAATEKAILSADKRVKQVMEIGWEDSASGREIVNTNGVHVADENRSQVLYAGVAVEENGKVKDGFHVEIVPDLAKVDPAEIARKTVEDALDELGGTPIPSGSYPVIFERRAMTSLFGALTDMYSGDLIGKGISPLKDKLGEAIFSEKITVVDDPRCTDALRVLAYDDEGCPTRRKVLVDRGVFRTPLHNTKSAARMGAESTGNGFKHGYAGTVSVSPMNCSILPGTQTLEELMAQMGDGLVITRLAGLHAGLNHVTGDFSLQCFGYRVKDGKRERNVALITAAGNFLEMMKKVVAVGCDLDWEYRTIACPSVAFESCAIAGE